MKKIPPYIIKSLGDAALIIDFGNTIDEKINHIVYTLFFHLNKNPIEGVTELIPGYCSLTLCYDVNTVLKSYSPNSAVFEWLGNKVKDAISAIPALVEIEPSLIKVPVCYDKIFGTDLDHIAERNQISVEEIIQIHTSSVYHIYMLGFLPGFAYMGKVDERIATPRKKTPVNVEEGCVGIAGFQTGIYPLTSPGGWQIIGKCPLKIFSKEKNGTTLFKAGDRVQFYSISKDEFEDIKSRNT